MTLPAAKMEDTRKRLDERVSRLSRAVILDLGQSHITKVAVQRDVGWLERLGCLDQARDVFLTNRTKVVRQRMGQVKYSRFFVYCLSKECFDLISNLCDYLR